MAIFGLYLFAVGQNCIEFEVCDDGNLCTVDDRCIDGECIGIQMDCDDGDPCTINSCDPSTGCQFIPIVCEDNDPCTINVCEDGNCVFIPHGCPCDDNDPCTENDVYINGTCIGIPKVCDDGNPCTDDICVNGECIFTDNTNSCDDGDPCTVNDQCIDGVCVGTPMDCDDGDPCTIDSCDPILGCQHELIICEDNDPCTINTCEDGNCVFIPHGCPCDDNDPCTENDVFVNGICTGTPIMCDDGDPCTDDICVNGQCVFIDNTNSCDDGDPCTINDRCVDGVCVGTPMNCDDSDPCTVDSCDPITGCKHEYPNNVFTVTSNADQGPGTLREFISLACDRDTIKFDAGISQININSPIAIQYDISIIGNGKHNLVINGQQTTRIFGIAVNADVKLTGFTLRNGFSSNNGGAFYNLGVVRLSHMALIDNYEGASRKAWSSVNTVIIDEGSCEIR